MLTKPDCKCEELCDSLISVLSNLGHNLCEHPTLVRKGSIWTVCEDCGVMWADDKGGFKPYVAPEWLTKATALVSEFTKGKPREAVKEDVGAARSYLSTLIKLAAPEVVPTKTLVGLVSQLDNILSGSLQRVLDLEKEVAALRGGD